MGGQISVQSRSGIGSTFSFTVVCQPLVNDEQGLSITGPEGRPGSMLFNQAVEAVSLSERLRDKRVLLVEDNAVNAALARRFLADLNMKVTLAENGPQAVEQASAQHFDVVLID